MALSLVHTIDSGIWGFKVLFSVGYTYDELTSELKKQKCDGWLLGLRDDKELIDSGDYFALGRYPIIDGKKYYHYYIILSKSFDFSDEEVIKLAHEVLHICQFALSGLLNMDNEYEAVAYTHTHLMRQCLQIMRESENILKKRKARRVSQKRKTRYRT
jgi:hypothetical protein